jgi:L-fuconate dehydratase
VPRILALDTYDVRFPTSRTLAGSDAMNPAPDYAAAYAVLRTDGPDELAGHGFTFTIGRFNDVQVAAIAALAPAVVGTDVDELVGDLGGFSRRLVRDSQLRWLGPETGIAHMAVGAIVNACWDLKARRAGLPLWRLLCELTPAELVTLVDFRYLEDAITPAEALDLLERAADGKAGRIRELEAGGYSAYSTAPGWLGYADDHLARLIRQAMDEGFDQIKLKVGGSLDDDVRRLTLARKICGPDYGIAIDANQVWGASEAISWIRQLSGFNLAWIEEPTFPNDILAMAEIRRAVAPVPIAAGEHVANRVVFKQLLQAGALDIMQIDATRVAGVSENVANLLLAAKAGIRVCPHAGGVGLCEAVQHLSFFDYACVSGTMDDRVIEWIDHLHEHFVSPAVMRDGRYLAPAAAGNSMEIRADSIREYSYPDGPAWAGEAVLTERKHS